MSAFLVCWTCGGFIGRRRGNLRRDASWFSAIEALLLRHLVRHEREAQTQTQHCHDGDGFHEIGPRW